MYNTPILFLLFNRPDTTQIVFERIREVKPAKLYIAADAARPEKPGEEEKCKEARRIAERVDWECEVHTLFRTTNLGCKKAVSEAISWFFTHEEMGIILEDDCLPDLSFFGFCEELLVKYKEDQMIGHIGGNRFLPPAPDNKESYDFCHVTHIWGWATWRRVWEKVNIDFPFWERYPERRGSLFCNKWEEIYFSSFISDALHKRNGLNPWGVFYYFSLRLQNQLSIYPKVNLVTNIGLNSPDATHTTKKNSKLVLPLNRIDFPLHHPEYRIANKEIDKKAVKYSFFSYKRLLRYFLKLY
ncbi:MAG: hypothetical protein LUD74_06045 [Tannerellaceae bacterium]|nr:hypothetical protein [Tannerellaceae bacterium]